MERFIKPGKFRPRKVTGRLSYRAGWRSLLNCTTCCSDGAGHGASDQPGEPDSDTQPQHEARWGAGSGGQDPGPSLSATLLAASAHPRRRLGGGGGGLRPALTLPAGARQR